MASVGVDSASRKSAIKSAGNARPRMFGGGKEGAGRKSIVGRKVRKKMKAKKRRDENFSPPFSPSKRDAFAT